MASNDANRSTKIFIGGFGDYRKKRIDSENDKHSRSDDVMLATRQSPGASTPAHEDYLTRRQDSDPVRRRQAWSTAISVPSTTNLDHLHTPQHKNLWRKYRPLLHVKQGSGVTMAELKQPDGRLYAIKTVSTADKERHLQAIQQISLHRDVGIDRVWETFDWHDKLFVVTTYTKWCVVELIISKKYPAERQLAYIAQKVISSLAFLEERDLVHGSLDATSILIQPSGEVILAHPACWRPRSKTEPCIDTAAFAHVMVRLMDKDAVPRSQQPACVTNSQQWSRTLVDFISCANKQNPVALKEHLFLGTGCHPSEMVGITAIADHAAWTTHDYFHDHDYFLS